MWAQIPGLIEQRQARTYDQAVALLVDLHALAVHQDRLPEFREQLAVIRSQYPTLRGFHSRLAEHRLS